MLKKYFLGLIIILTVSHADKDAWFMELGWQISLQYTSESYNTFDDLGRNGVHIDGEGTEDMMYFQVGKALNIKNSSIVLEPSIGTTFALLEQTYFSNALFIELPVLYKMKVFNTKVKLGPKIKYLYHYNHYYVDSEYDEAKKAEYDTHSAWAVGFKAVWGVEDWKLVTGLEYLGSAKYSANTQYKDGYANSEVDMNGVYFSIGLRHNF